MKHVVLVAIALGIAGLFASQSGLAGYVQAGIERQQLMDARISGRVDRTRALSLNSFLPGAPEGWTRRKLSGDDNDALRLLRGDGSRDEARLDGAVSTTLDLRDAYGWVYERGTRAILIEARVVFPEREALLATRGYTEGGRSRDLNSGITREDRGWAVLQGVAFSKREFSNGAGRKVRGFTGRIGDRQGVRIDVRATASDADVRMLLDQIDFDGINANLLDHPRGDVGRTAGEVPLEEQAAKATEELRLRARGASLPPEPTGEVVVRHGKDLKPVAEAAEETWEMPEFYAMFQRFFAGERKPSRPQVAPVCQVINGAKRCRIE